MGILNVTPDSFSDGGRFLAPESAIAHGIALAREGADIIDVGGESTRPGAGEVSIEEELRRVLPVVEGLLDARSASSISIDTSKSEVAARALAAGASLVNDVSALRRGREMAQVIAAAGSECCLMHMQGEPATMQREPRYLDVVDEVKAFLEERLSFAVGEGIREERVLLDPGIGFGKTAAHNLSLLERLDELLALGRPIVIGTSRKSFLGRIAADAAGEPDPSEPEARLPATIASNVLALERGASVFRVHDVRPVRDALALAAATLASRWTARSSPSATS